MSCTRCSLGAPWPVRPPVTATGLRRMAWARAPPVPAVARGCLRGALGALRCFTKVSGKAAHVQGWLSVFVRWLSGSFRRPLGFVAGLAIRPLGHFPTPRRKQSLALTLKGPRRLSGQESHGNRPGSRAHSAGFLPTHTPLHPTPPPNVRPTPPTSHQTAAQIGHRSRKPQLAKATLPGTPEPAPRRFSLIVAGPKPPIAS